MTDEMAGERGPSGQMAGRAAMAGPAAMAGRAAMEGLRTIVITVTGGDRDQARG